MKNIFSFLVTCYLILSTCYSVFAQETFRLKNPKLIVYVLPIQEDIGAASARHIKEGIAEAKKLKADYIILHINTYGGLLDAADSMRTRSEEHTSELQSPCN